MRATPVTTSEIPKIYRCFAGAVGAEQWQGAVDRSEKAIRSNHFLGDYLRSEHAISYQLDRLRKHVASFGTVPTALCNDPSIFPSVAFAAQVLEVLDGSTFKQCKEFVKRVRNAFSSAENMHGLRLELNAATHFAGLGQRVVWHRVKHEGSFDLLVENLGPEGLEVECKSISENKGRRIHHLCALEFWGELWKDLAGVAHSLRSGLAVVLTVPDRLPTDPSEKAALAREVIARILVSSGGPLSGGANLRLHEFDLSDVKVSKDNSHDERRNSIDALTGTANREAIVYGTPAGGILILAMQSAVADDVFDQVFSTLNKYAPRQFTGKRGALFWVSLQGLDADQLLSVHKQDCSPGVQPSELRLRASDFLNGAPNYVVGVAFASRGGLLQAVGNRMGSGGATNFFLNESSPHWHASFRDPLRT